jgi:hypothetical protein
MRAEKILETVVIMMGVLVILGISMPFILPKIMPTPVAVRNAQAEGVIAECYDGIEMLEVKRKMPLRLILAANSAQTGDLNQQITRELYNAKVIGADWDRIDTNTMHIIDYWGRPLCFSWPDDIGGKGPLTKLTNTAVRIIVWSLGANGTNEYGNGDDVVVDKIPAFYHKDVSTGVR